VTAGVRVVVGEATGVGVRVGVLVTVGVGVRVGVGVLVAVGAGEDRLLERSPWRWSAVG